MKSTYTRRYLSAPLALLVLKAHALSASGLERQGLIRGSFLAYVRLGAALHRWDAGYVVIVGWLWGVLECAR